jgi:UDP-glucuronate 4-epimerase
MTRLLVTGAAGFIGSHVVEAALAQGHEVVGVDNFDPVYDRATKEANLAGVMGSDRFEFHEADIRDRIRIGQLLEPGTVVIHLAARAGVRPSFEQVAEYADINVTGTASVARAALDAGANRMVFASSASVYGDGTPLPFREDAAAMEPASPYAASKRAGELLLDALARATGLRVAALRYFSVYGPRQRPDLAIHTFCRQLLRGEPVTLFGDGSARRDYTFVGDAVRTTLAAADWTANAEPGVTTFNVCAAAPVALRDMVEAVAGELGVTPELRFRPLPPGDVQATAGDPARAAKVLGHQPQTTFAEGVAQFVAWFGEAHAEQR